MINEEKLVIEFITEYDEIVDKMHNLWAELEELRGEKKLLAKNYELKGLSKVGLDTLKSISHKRYANENF